MSSQPLAGLRVADFSRVLAGPLATMVLADLGAEVVKIERPGVGDDTRAWTPPQWSGTSTYYLSLNRNKQSIALDLMDRDDLAVAKTLALRSDVLIENFRPGYLEERGLGYDAVKAENPGVVYCSISAFGRDGPAAGIAGYDLLVQAMSGLMHVTGPADGDPHKVGVALVDVLTGLYAVTGILAALTERASGPDGTGEHIEVSLFDAALASMVNQAEAAILGGTEPGRDGNRHPSIAPYEVVHARDGAFVLAAGNDKLFQRTCAVLGCESLVADPRYATNEARRANVDALIEDLERRLASESVATWIERLRAVGVPAGPVHSLGEALAWAEHQGLAPYVEDAATGFRAVRSPIKLGGTTPSECTTPPALDADGPRIRRTTTNNGKE